MALYSINNFWYDEESRNIYLNLMKRVDVDYAVNPEYGEAMDYYEAQLFLDGGFTLIGKVRPDSLDGTIHGGTFGKISSDPTIPEGGPLADAPE